MSNVVKFPSNRHNEWDSVREILGESIEQWYKEAVGEDIPTYMKREVLDRMAVVYKEMGFAPDISVYVEEEEYPAVHEVLRQFINDFHEHLMNLVYSRLMVEMERAYALHVMKTR